MDEQVVMVAWEAARKVGRRSLGRIRPVWDEEDIAQEVILHALEHNRDYGRLPWDGAVTAVMWAERRAMRVVKAIGVRRDAEREAMAVLALAGKQRSSSDAWVDSLLGRLDAEESGHRTRGRA